MAKRNRQRQKVQSGGKKPAVRDLSPLKTLLAMDGFVNRMAYLGEASLLQEASDYERHSITRDYEKLTVMYRENWIAKRIIDTPCEDMTRSWYSVTSALSQGKLDELAQLEAKNNIKQELTNALRWARLYGGAAAVMVIKGQEDMLDQPLEYDDLIPGCFRGVIVVDRTSGLEPSMELEEDMDDPEFGYPKYYDVWLDAEKSQIVRVHHSRMLLFRGRMLPIMEEVAENYWGASELEHVYEELQKRNATSANIAQLVFQANVGVLKMADYGEIMGMGTDKQKQQVVDNIYTQNRIRNSFGMMIMGNEDGYEQHPYSFSGLSEVYESFMMDMAGAAEIPATKLYGRSPQGMNATGESDMKNYYEMLSQLQERILRPAIEKLLPVMCLSLWGKIPNDLKVIFEPLQITTPSEKAQIASQVTGVVIQAFSAGLISQQTALMELRKEGKDIGFWGSITEELIEKADAEVDSGEGGMGGMGGIGGMMPPDGGMPPDDSGMPPEGPEGEPPEEMPEMKPDAPQEPQNESEPAPGDSDEEALAKILQEAKGAKEAEKQPDEEEKAEDGGPGSGNFNHPGYRRGGGLAPQTPDQPKRQRAGLAERVAFMANPASALPEQKTRKGIVKGPTGSKSQVERNNRERRDWANLTMHQRIQGNSEQQKHMAKMKADVLKAAAKGDLETAKKIVRQNRQYWANDPDSAMKVQSETLKRQKAVKPRQFFHDAWTFLTKPFGRKKMAQDSRAALIKSYANDHSAAETADYIMRFMGLDAEEVEDEEIWRTTEEGRHFKFETSTGEVKAGFGGKFTGKKLGEQWTPNSGKSSKKGGKVVAPAKSAPKVGKKVTPTFNVSSTGIKMSKAFAAETAARYEESRKEAEQVFGKPGSSREQKEEALSYLASTAGGSDQWNEAQRGDAPYADEFGLGKVPREWLERLTPNEQEVLAGISKETDNLSFIENESWSKKNEEAANTQMALQAKLLGAEIDVPISADLLEKYAGIEKREEVPGQQSMFWGENVPSETPTMREGSEIAGGENWRDKDWRDREMLKTLKADNAMEKTMSELEGIMSYQYGTGDPDGEAFYKDLEWISKSKDRDQFVERADQVFSAWQEKENDLEDKEDAGPWENAKVELGHLLEREKSNQNLTRELENRFKNSSTPVAKESGIRYNVGGAAPVLSKTPAKKFHEAFHKAKDAVARVSPEKSWRVDGSYAAEDYEHMDCYTTPGGSCVAVHDGDIVSVCGAPGDTVRGSDLLKHAVQMGGKKLDAFGGLYGFYAKNGFEPVSWCKFADVEGIRPPDWDRTRDKPEPVIFWKYTGKSYQDIVSEYGRDSNEFTRKVKESADYDAAMEERNRSMEV